MLREGVSATSTRMSALFSPLTLRGVTFRNRIGVSPMCQYSSTDGLANAWHMVHLGSRAVGGAGLVMTEATAVTPEGRISPSDLGIWSDAHAGTLAPIAAFIASRGAQPGIQLAHAGRKASVAPPWKGGRWVPPDEGGWHPIGPSPVRYGETHALPHEMEPDAIRQIVDDFAAAARRAVGAGFRVVECHMAHGYLLHSFLSPLSNKRTDGYGGDLVNRMRLPLQVAGAVRDALPPDMPLFVRISATDWIDGGWTIEDSVELARRLKEVGVDMIDCSSGAIVAEGKLPAAPGFQVPLAARIRKEAGIPTAAVGLITTTEQAVAILDAGQADIILFGRALLRDPYWPIRAAEALGAESLIPIEYARAAPFREDR